MFITKYVPTSYALNQIRFIVLNESKMEKQKKIIGVNELQSEKRCT